MKVTSIPILLNPDDPVWAELIEEAKARLDMTVPTPKQAIDLFGHFITDEELDASEDIRAGMLLSFVGIYQLGRAGFQVPPIMQDLMVIWLEGVGRAGGRVVPTEVHSFHEKPKGGA